MLAVTDFLQVHNCHVSVLEEQDDGRCEEFILGSGEQRLGRLYWDAHGQHASMVPLDVSVDSFSTEVSSQPWMRSAVGADFLSHNLPASMRLFKPSNVSPNVEPNGYILVDSFHYFKKQKKKTVFYLPELLEELYRCTGHVIYALCSGGAAFAHRSNGAALYSEMLNRVPSNLDFLMLLSFGNDWYGQTVRPLTQPTRVAAEQTCLRMKALARRQFAVIGGSSQTWDYKSWMQPNSMNQYDANADALVNVFQNMGVCAVTGADELENLTLADTV